MIVIYPWVRSANTIFFYLLPVLFVVGLFIAFFTDTWLLAFLLGAPIVALPMALIKLYPDAPITRISVGIAVQLITALHIQQTAGMIEIHFQIFVLLAFLVFYRDWRVIAAATGVVAVHHILFYILQTNDVPVMVFMEGRVSFSLLMIHAIYALVEGALLMYVAIGSHKNAVASLRLTQHVDDILKDPEKLDLSIEIEEINEDSRKFNQVITAIKQLIAQTRNVGATLNKISMHVADLSNSLSDSLQETASHVDSIASASDEMSSTIAHVSTNANEVNSTATETKDLSSNARNIIQNSNNDVTELRSDLEKTSTTINELSDKCDRISQVMEAIKVISEQTNLLALNAAIESARAGEHGRGFAVVADEVRSLSIKTRESVEEISEVSQDLINDGKASVAQMKQCLESAERAMTASAEAVTMIDQVQAAIARVEESIADVADSAKEQSAASSSIASSAQHLADLSQQEKNSAQESLSEVTILRQHSEELERQLAKFNV